MDKCPVFLMGFVTGGLVVMWVVHLAFNALETDCAKKHNIFECKTIIDARPVKPEKTDGETKAQ